MPDGELYLKKLSDIDRARLYPYTAPDSGYVLAHGMLYNFDQTLIDGHSALLDGRTPVLSVGSNRAPIQLISKFGNQAVVPVTPARLIDFDIVHAAMLGYYAAVPCTAFPCKGCVVSLNVAWLDAAQLLQMHRTEGIGVAYDYVVMRNVQHDLAVPDCPVHGYVARSGALDCGGGIPAALPTIHAVGRCFPLANQFAAAARVRQLAGYDDDRSHSEFIADAQSKKSIRETVSSRLRPFAILYTRPGWQVITLSVDGLDAYL